MNSNAFKLPGNWRTIKLGREWGGLVNTQNLGNFQKSTPTTTRPRIQCFADKRAADEPSPTRSFDSPPLDSKAPTGNFSIKELELPTVLRPRRVDSLERVSPRNSMFHSSPQTFEPFLRSFSAVSRIRLGTVLFGEFKHLELNQTSLVVHLHIAPRNLQRGQMSETSENTANNTKGAPGGTLDLLKKISTKKKGTQKNPILPSRKHSKSNHPTNSCPLWTALNFVRPPPHNTHFGVGRWRSEAETLVRYSCRRATRKRGETFALRTSTELREKRQVVAKWHTFNTKFSMNQNENYRRWKSALNATPKVKFRRWSASRLQFLALFHSSKLPNSERVSHFFTEEWNPGKRDVIVWSRRADWLPKSKAVKLIFSGKWIWLKNKQKYSSLMKKFRTETSGKRIVEDWKI